jgi:large conductance mechanosensitive channel
MRQFFEDFKKFLLRGNVIDLAVAVVIGTAFNAVVQSFTNDVLLQLIAAVVGEPDFSGLTFTLNDAEIRYGAFITALVSFVIIGFAVFVAVKAFEAMQNLRRSGAADADTPAPSDEAVLLTEIRDLLRSQAR